MTHYFTRCIYCNRVYSYQGSGGGCLSPENSRYYCPECQKIINRALEEYIPKDKLVYRRPKEVDVEVISPEIQQRMIELKNGSGNGIFPAMCQMVAQLNFDNIDIFDIDLITYHVCWNNDDKEKHYFIDYEYNYETKKYGNVYMDYDYNRDEYHNSYRRGQSWERSFMRLSELYKNNKPITNENVIKMTDLFNDIEYWEVKTNFNNEK